MAQLLNCGFARSLVLAGTIQYHWHDVYDRIYDDYLSRFDGIQGFESNRKYMTVKFKEYAAFIRSKKIETSLKDLVRNTFSTENWNKLELTEKEKHSLKDCQECIRSDVLKKFPAHVKGRKPKIHRTKTVKTLLESPVSVPAAVVSSTPVTPANPATPAIQTNPTTPVIPTAPTTPVIQTNSTTSLIQMNHTTPMIQMEPTTPMIQTSPQTPMIQPYPTTPEIQSNPTTPVIPSASTTPVIQTNSTTSLIQTNPTTPMIQMEPTTPMTQTNRTTPITPTARFGIRNGLKKKVMTDITNLSNQNAKKSRISPKERTDCQALIRKFDETHKKSFVEVATRIKGSKLMKKMTKGQNQQKNRNYQRDIVAHSKENQRRDNRDMYAVVASGSSYKAHMERRANGYFEPIEETRARAKKTEKRGGKKRRIHIPNNWDKKGLLDYVTSLPDNSPLNLTKIGNMFGVPNNHHQGNKIVKQFLLDNGIDLTRFDKKWVKRLRRLYPRMPGSTGITDTIPRSAKELKAALYQEIEKGNIKLGRLIAPRTYTKIMFDPDNDKEIITKTFQVSGRKIPLREIREQINADHHKLGLMRPLPCVRRNLAVWADHSTILNHGHMLLTVKPIFTKEIYYTAKEMTDMHGGEWNVQQIVERPSVYIFGRADDTTLEKLSYVETRAEDIKDLSEPTHINGQIVTDILRFFLGDHPELQFESGNQQGGDYPCLCGVNKHEFTDLETILRSKVMDSQQRKNFLESGPAGRRNVAKPYDKLKSSAVIDELIARDCPDWQKCKDAGEREKLLRRVLKGVVRKPSLLHDDHISVEDIKSYEICPCEPLHDLKGHISNLWEILPEFLTEEEKKIFEEMHSVLFKDKNQIKGCDYRLSVIVIYHCLAGRCRYKIEVLLESLMQITKLAYLPSEKRTPRVVLLTYNVTFIHAVSVINLFGKSPNSKKISNTKMYGIYSHSIFAHFASVQRIIPLSSTHCESQERTFTKLNKFAKNTSNRSLDSVRDNGIIRIQCEQKVRNETNPFTAWKSDISKYATATAPIKNTVIWKGMCSERVYQAHLERISDFLLPGEGIWWHRNHDTGDFIFHDGDGEPEYREQGPALQDFQFESLSSSYTYLENCWTECIQSKVNLPINNVLIFDQNDDFLGKRSFDYPLPNGNGDDEESDTEEEEEETHLVVEPVEKEWESNTLFPPMKKINKQNAAVNNENKGMAESDLDGLFITHDDDPEIQSKIGKAILKVIGPSANLANFDKNYRMSTVFKGESKYTKLTLASKVSIIHQLKELRLKSLNWISEWEKHFFVQNLSEPKPTDNDRFSSIANDKLKLSEQILRKWNVTFK